MSKLGEFRNRDRFLPDQIRAAKRLWKEATSLLGGHWDFITLQLGWQVETSTNPILELHTISTTGVIEWDYEWEDVGRIYKVYDGTESSLQGSCCSLEWMPNQEAGKALSFLVVRERIFDLLIARPRRQLKPPLADLAHYTSFSLATAMNTLLGPTN